MIFLILKSHAKFFEKKRFFFLPATLKKKISCFCKYLYSICNYKNRFILSIKKNLQRKKHFKALASIINKNNKKMDDDMRRSLLNKKSATFDKQYE